MTLPSRQPSRVVGWSVISPIGIGRKAFADALASGTAGRKPLPPDFPVPLESACTVPEFDKVRFLGSKGTRSMDRLTAMVIATAGMVLEESAAVAAPPGSLGVVLGTSTGSVASITEFTRETFVRDKPYLVDPGAFPNTVMNSAAGQCAIWHKLQGANSTVSAGQLSSLHALRYATSMIDRGRAESLLVGAVEEFSAPMAWADYHLRDGRQRDAIPPGEGCAMFMVSRAAPAASRDDGAVAELLGFEFGVWPPAPDGGQADGLAGCIRAALDGAGVAPREIWAVSSAQCCSLQLNQVERAAIDKALDGAGPRHRLTVSELVGDCFSASGAFQLAALLALAERERGGGPKVSLITSLGPDGGAGCALVRTL